MKYLIMIVALLSVMTFAAPAHAQKTTGSNPIGGTVIKPGETKTNGDGVKVTNDKDSKKNATMTPKKGSSDSKTKVKLGRGTKGRVDDIDSSDSVDVGNGSDVTITGTGGTVTLSGGSTVTVTNTAPVGSNETITVNTPSGVTVNVPGGSSTTIST